MARNSWIKIGILIYALGFGLNSASMHFPINPKLERAKETALNIYSIQDSQTRTDYDNNRRELDNLRLEVLKKKHDNLYSNPDVQRDDRIQNNLYYSGLAAMTFSFIPIGIGLSMGEIKNKKKN